MAITSFFVFRNFYSKYAIYIHIYLFKQFTICITYITFSKFFKTTQASCSKSPNYSVKKQQFLILYLDSCHKRPNRVLCMGSKFPLHEPIAGRVWDSGLDYVRKTILETLIMIHNCYEIYFES